MAANVLWVGDLDATMDDTFLRRALAQAGENVVSIKIIKNKQTGSSQGYGFVGMSEISKYTGKFWAEIIALQNFVMMQVRWKRCIL